LANLLHGQVALTGSAQQLDPNGTSGSASVFIIKTPVSNAAKAFVGSSSVTTSNGHIFDPGDELSYERISQNGQPGYQQRVSDFWVVGTTGDVVSWLALQ
jgi:hypothetical protein